MKINVEFVQLDDVDFFDSEAECDTTNVEVQIPDDLKNWSKEELAMLYAKASLLDEGFSVSIDHDIQFTEIK